MNAVRVNAGLQTWLDPSLALIGEFGMTFSFDGKRKAVGVFMWFAL